MGLKFSATSLENCIEKACDELNISKDDLRYKVIKEEKRFFKKIVEIEVIDEEGHKTNIREKEAIEEVEELNEFFGAKVENGKIIVTEFENKDEIITIKPCAGMILLINGQQVNGVTPVTAEDKLEYKFEEIEPIRSMDVSITSDKMEAYITIKCIPAHTYELIDQGYHKNLILSKKKISDKYPPKYTRTEIKELLQSKGIRFGIIEEELDIVCSEYGTDNVLIAKGLPAKDDISDEIQVLFKESEEVLDYEDTNERVDYRNRFLIANVKTGDIIGKIVPGTAGNDGQNILGVPIKRKTAKKVVVKISEGCKLENNTIIATEEGKPAYRANTFAVNKLYKVDQVDLKSGNIDFVGNVEIVGNVCEAMEVKAGNELHVGKNVESATVRSSGEIVVNGNILNSTVTAGSENVERKQYLDNLMNFKTIISDLTTSIKQVKENNLLGQKQDGEVIKILIENKFKSLPKITRSILNYNMSEGVQYSDLTTFIINKLLGLGPLKIKDFKELTNLERIVQEEIEEIETLIVIPSDIYMAYAQGSTIEASGNIYITGKGQYTSDITALNKIEFTNEKSACRGGVLSAGTEIILKSVGSVAGVNTILKVPKNGHIRADIAYNNTIFCFGEKQKMLEISAKNVDAYLDKSGEIIIDKFVL